MTDVKKPKNRLSSVKVLELSIVDRPANKNEFLLFKRDDGGTMTLEELTKALEAAKKELEVSKTDKEALTKKVGELEEQVKKLTPPAKVKKSELDEDGLVKSFDDSVKLFKADFDEYMDLLKIGRTFNSKNESVIQSAYDALGNMLQEAEKRKKKKPPKPDPSKDTQETDMGKGLEEMEKEYKDPATTPERKKEIEKQLEEFAKAIGVEVKE